MDLVLGLDLGTTGCRAVAFDAKTGARVAAADAEYALHAPLPGWAEQDAEEVFAATCATIRSVTSAPAAHDCHIIALGFSAALHSALPLAADGTPLTRALIWADGRAKDQMTRLAAKFGARALHARTGCAIHPMYPSAKIAWFRENHPELTARTATYASIKDYVVLRLTGELVTDRSLASGTGLCTLGGGDWDDDVLHAVGINRSMLPPIAPTTHALRSLLPEVARDLGLQSETPVVLGAGDGMLANLGVGGCEPGHTAITVGTSGAVRTVVTSPGVDDGGRTWCYNLAEGYWVRGGAVNNGGIILRWFRDVLTGAWEGERAVSSMRAAHLSYDDICRAAALSPAGAGGLVLIPMLTGERTPYWNPDARGVLLGMSLKTTRADIARAVLEGVAYSMRDAYSALADALPLHGPLLATGSFTRSSEWTQIMADVIGKPVRVSSEPDASALGAAILALVGTERMTLAQASKLTRPPHAPVNPDPEHHKTYSSLFQIYRSVYRAACPAFAELARFQSGEASR